MGVLGTIDHQPHAFQLKLMIDIDPTYLECELLKACRETWKRLIPGSSFGDNSELRSRTGDISACYLNAANIRSVVREGGRSGYHSSQTTFVGGLSTALPAKGKLCISSNRRPRDHCSSEIGEG
jgi:hypothetical protein